MREVFDDKDVDGVVIATPEQWHALATIWACQAGKDVYVERCIAPIHRNWHGWWDFSGGNSSDGIHQLDLARMLLGEPPHPTIEGCRQGRLSDPR